MVKFARALAASMLVCVASDAFAQQRADAVLIVNSASARYADARQRIRPYLDHFGVPYTVLDIATTPIGPEIASYALIIIGHADLDTGGAYLSAAEQANLSNAVSQGSGLVNFDYDLASGIRRGAVAAHVRPRGGRSDERPEFPGLCGVASASMMPAPTTGG